jgi:hypothetical protein
MIDLNVSAACPRLRNPIMSVDKGTLDSFGIKVRNLK